MLSKKTDKGSPELPETLYLSTFFYRARDGIRTRDPRLGKAIHRFFIFFHTVSNALKLPFPCFFTFHLVSLFFTFFEFVVRFHVRICHDPITSECKSISNIYNRFPSSGQVLFYAWTIAASNPAFFNFSACASALYLAL